MKNNKSFIFAIILVTITFTLLNIIKIVSRPKVAFIGDNDRRVTRIESQSGFMYYDDKLEMVVYIGKHCFSYCENPEKVYLTKSIEVVGSEIFLNCKKLKEVTLSKMIAYGIEFNENVKLIYIE